MAIELTEVASGYSTGVINSNFEAIEAYINDKLLNRDGTSTGEANQLELSLDMNSNFIFNLPEPTLEHQAARLKDVQNAINGADQANLITFTPYGNISSENVQGAIQEIVDGTGQSVTTSTGTDQTLVEALDSRAIYVDTIADMLALPINVLLDGACVYVREYSAGSGVGGGNFTWHAGATDAENGITVFGNYASGRFKRPDVSEVPITWAGATVDSADNSAEIQAVIDFCRGNTKCVYIDSGTFEIVGSGLAAEDVRIKGAGQRQSVIKNLAGSVLLPSRMVNVTDVAFEATGAPVISQSGVVFESLWERVRIKQSSSDQVLWDNNTEGLIEARFISCEFLHVQGATVHGFDLVSNPGGFINNNLWLNCRATNSGRHFWNVESEDSVPQFHNEWRGVNFEYCLGGGIRQVGCLQFVIEGCANWDADLFGEIQDHFYLLETNASNVANRGRIQGCGRWTGGNASGVHDVKLSASPWSFGTIIEDCYAIGTGKPFSADLNSNQANTRNGSGLRFSTTNDANAFIQDYRDGIVNKLEIGSVRNYSINQASLPQSYDIVTLSSKNVLKLIVQVGNSGGHYTFQEWAVSYGFSGTRGNTTKLFDHRTDATNSPAVNLSIDAAGVVNVFTSGGTGWTGRFDLAISQA